MTVPVTAEGALAELRTIVRTLTLTGEDQQAARSVLTAHAQTYGGRAMLRKIAELAARRTIRVSSADYGWIAADEIILAEIRRRERLPMDRKHVGHLVRQCRLWAPTLGLARTAGVDAIAQAGLTDDLIKAMTTIERCARIARETDQATLGENPES